MNKNKFIHTKQFGKHDCGIACLSSLMKFYNFNYGIDYLKDFTVEKQGYNLKDLISILKNFESFSSKPVKIKNENLDNFLNQINSPCIALMDYEDGGHYIVIYKKEKDKLIISDPEEKKISKLSIQEFKDNFSGIMLIVQFLTNTNTINNKQSFKKNFFKQIIKENIKSLILVFILSILLVMITMGLSMYLKVLVDFIIPMHLDSYLPYLGLIFLSCNLLLVLFNYIRNISIIKVSYKIDKQMGEIYFQKIIKLPIKFFENRNDGEIISIFNDSTYIRSIFSVNIVSAILDITIIIGTSILLYKMNSLLFLTVLVPILLLICLTVIFYDILDKRNRDLMRDKAKTTSFLVQFIKNMPTIYSLNKKKYFLSSFDSMFKQQRTSTLKEAKSVNHNYSLKFLIQSSVSIIVLWVGTQQVLTDQITLGTLLFINSLVLFLVNSLDKLINIQAELQKGIVAADRFFSILDYPTQQTKKTKEIQDISEIKLCNFSFSFDNYSNVIENVNLSIHKNERVLLVGESGTGKSTLAKVLAKLYSIDDSKVLIDNTDINKFDTEELRKKIIYLNENPFLFKGTIKENLCMGENFSEEDIIKACQISEIFDFILALPKAFEFTLKEHATNLSTGQKQRLVLARAILHTPNFLILDESISNIDSKTSKKIYENLSKLNFGIVFITHNPELIEQYDKKFILENKTITEIKNNKEVYI
ncbi:peptidase domain-containing ABC transporter [Bacillus cereus]|nr:peptidase domain-containing ABC transporter [Bacillus cereus]